MQDFCIDCEKQVNARIYHPKGCVAACYACYRFGYGFPCAAPPDQRRITCPDCHFVFPNADCFQYHKLKQMPGQSRTFKSICQQRYMCEQCWKFVYTRGEQHKCGQTPSNEECCERCGGAHRWSMLCYIQPVGVDKLNSLLQRHRRPVKNPGSIDLAETDDELDDDFDNASSTSTTTKAETKAKPYRYFVFDIECSQEDEIQPGRFKHEALLVCAELICTECINNGIRIGAANNPLRPDTCICKGADFINHRVRRWVVPNTDGRQFQFHNFDDPNIQPLDEMLNFLCNHGPKNTSTLALSHNGNHRTSY